MGFVKFAQPGIKTREPKVAIWNRGQININSAAVHMYNVDKFKYCILYYDPDEKKIGIQLTNDDSATGAIKFNTRKGGARVISGLSFLNHFGISFGETENYTPEYDSEQKMIIINLRDKK